MLSLLLYRFLFPFRFLFRFRFLFLFLFPFLFRIPDSGFPLFKTPFFMHLFVIRKLLRVANEHSSGSPRILRSPKTPVKRAGSAVGKDTICLLCGTSLIGERCTFNVLQHVRLLQKMERLLDDQLNTNVQSSRVCRPCGRKVESLAKKKEVLTEQLKDLILEQSTRLHVTRCHASSGSQRLAQHPGPERNSEAL